MATNSGDLRCTRMVDRCLGLAPGEMPERFGEKAAKVGGLESLLFALPEPSSPLCADEGVISVIQGVSVVQVSRSAWREALGLYAPNAAMQEG